MTFRWDRSVPLGDIWIRVLLTGVAVSALVAARFFPFGALPPLCTFKNLTGVACLSCGMTRSWVHLVHGRIGAAIIQNPLGAVLCVATAVLLVYGALRTWGGLPALRYEGSKRESWLFRAAIVGLILANWSYVVISGVA